MKNNTKYKINEIVAINGYLKKGNSRKGECKMNIELTELAASIETNTSNILLQYVPIRNIIIIDMVK